MNVSNIELNQKVVLSPETVLAFSGSGGTIKSTAKKLKVAGKTVEVIKVNDASVGINAQTESGKGIRIPFKGNENTEIKAPKVPKAPRTRPTTAAVDPFNSLGNRVKTLDELREATPAVFATAPDGKVTSKYNFVPTEQIVNDILSLGWELHSAKQNGPQDTSRHMVRFTHPKMGNMPQLSNDNVKPQIILDNSHNRGSSAQIHMGLFRMVCTNGLVAAIPGMYNNVKFRHMGIDKEEIRQVLDAAASQYINIGDHVGDMQMISMHQDEREEFAIKSIAAREPHLFVKEDGTIDMKAITASTNPLDIIKPIRGEDEANNLWTVFNVIQERMIKGGYQRIASNGRNSTTRGVSSASRNIDLNKKIWTIAETFMPEIEEVVELVG